LSILRVYIDETGDRGVKPRSSPYFTMVAVIVRDSNDHLVRDYSDQLKLQISKQPGAKTKWMDLRHLERVVAARSLAALPIRLVYVCVPKVNIRNGTALQSNSGAFYNYAARFLVERISWFAKRHQARAHMVFERVKGFPPSELTQYLHLLRGRQTTIDWSHMSPNVRVDSPANYRALCAADVAAGIFDSATRPDLATGLVEPAYLLDVAPRIWRGPKGSVDSYGLKVLGSALPLEVLPWWPQRNQ
jgi:hypothetical protein